MHRQQGVAFASSQTQRTLGSGGGGGGLQRFAQRQRQRGRVVRSAHAAAARRYGGGDSSGSGAFQQQQQRRHYHHFSSPLQQQQQQRQHQRRRRGPAPAAATSSNRDPSPSARSGGGGAPSTAAPLLAELEVAVPADQRPVNELAQLKGAWLYSWGTLPEGDYLKRLAGLFAFFAVAIGGPISYVTFDPLRDPAEFVLSASVGALVVVAVACVRIFVGWKYVGDRLSSAAIAYEETGWYDGQTFVKPPEVLARDRLLAAYEVRPVLGKLRGTLLGAGGALLVCSAALAALIAAHSDADGVYGRGSSRAPRQVTATGVIYSKRVSDLSQLAADDELAAEEAAAMGGVPGYCADRLLRAAAGGMGCPKL